MTTCYTFRDQKWLLPLLYINQSINNLKTQHLSSTAAIPHLTQIQLSQSRCRHLASVVHFPFTAAPPSNHNRGRFTRRWSVFRRRHHLWSGCVIALFVFTSWICFGFWFGFCFMIWFVHLFAARSRCFRSYHGYLFVQIYGMFEGLWVSFLEIDRALLLLICTASFKAAMAIGGARCFKNTIIRFCVLLLILILNSYELVWFSALFWYFESWTLTQLFVLEQNVFNNKP
jgi:hypothetical protein